MMTSLETIISELRSCTVCSAHLPLGPRPVFQISTTATLLIASQAPGTKAHVSGVPFSDPSGDQLRLWMGVSADEFYDAKRVAIVPMAMCYPGRAQGGGDAPPRTECAKLWRESLLQQLVNVKLTLLVGTHSPDYVLGPGLMTDRVRNFEQYLPRFFPLPHPSWRSRGWVKKNPWFEQCVLPRLREEVALDRATSWRYLQRKMRSEIAKGKTSQAVNIPSGMTSCPRLIP